MKKGFTLIELLVVIAIIGVLTSVVLASLNNAQNRMSENANYRVEFEGKGYYVESYTKELGGDCVFLSEFETRFCGDWSVKKLDKEEE